MLLVNLYGAPSAGKSTGAAYIFSQLKLYGINTELICEFAKEKVWEGNKEALDNQLYILGNQYYRLTRLQNKVDVAITDSPILLSTIYNRSKLLGENFNKLVNGISKAYESINYFVLRNKPYNPKGRLQTEMESEEMVYSIMEMLKKYKVDYTIVQGNANGYDQIVDAVIEYLDLDY